MQKIWDTITKGIQEYCKKSGLTEVVLGLSGGLDSAMISVLACDALGADKVHAIVMPSKYSSTLSLDIAKQMQDLHGFDCKTFDIEPLTELALGQLTTLFKGEKPKKLLEENLQTRIRCPIVLGAVSNQYNYLVLSTSNKTEVMLGYMTFGGDTFGGFSPLGNVYKTSMYELARWRNSVSYSFPEEVLTRKPTAELSENQTDEGALQASYPVLDAILILKEKGYSIEDIANMGFTSLEVVSNIFALVARNHFKIKVLPETLQVSCPIAKSVLSLILDKNNRLVIIS